MPGLKLNHASKRGHCCWENDKRNHTIAFILQLTVIINNTWNIYPYIVLCLCVHEKKEKRKKNTFAWPIRLILHRGTVMEKRESHQRPAPLLPFLFAKRKKETIASPPQPIEKHCDVICEEMFGRVQTSSYKVQRFWLCLEIRIPMTTKI